jgi:hypothetical protein
MLEEKRDKKITEEARQTNLLGEQINSLIKDYITMMKMEINNLQDLISNIYSNQEEEAKQRVTKYKQQLEVKIVKAQKLQQERIPFTEQENQINYLELRVQELTSLIKTEKEKIFNIFARLLPEQKEELQLIQNLVITHLEFIKASKQKLSSVPLRRQRDKLRDALEEKLGDNLVEEIQSTLDDCEELIV